MSDARGRRAWDDRVGRVLDAYDAGDFGIALAALEEAAERFPEQAARATYWRACLLALLGERVAALRALEGGLADGLWWAPSELLGDEDLSPLGSLAGYAALLDVCGARHRAAQAEATAERLVLDAERSSSVLLVALHGRTETAADAAMRWRPATYRATVLAVGSSRLVAPGQRVWDDRALAARELGDAVEDVREERSVDRLVLGGFSQGGALAVEEALVGADAFVAVAPSLGRVGMRGPDELAELLPGAAVRRVRGVIVTGERDPRLANAERLAEDADAAGLAVRLDVVAGVGHVFPPDWPERLRDALAFALDG